MIDAEIEGRRFAQRTRSRSFSITHFGFAVLLFRRFLKEDNRTFRSGLLRRSVLLTFFDGCSSSSLLDSALRFKLVLPLTAGAFAKPLATGFSSSDESESDELSCFFFVTGVVALTGAGVEGAAFFAAGFSSSESELSDDSALRLFD